MTRIINADDPNEKLSPAELADHTDKQNKRNAIHAVLLAFTSCPASRVAFLLNVMSEIISFELELKPGNTDDELVDGLCDKLKSNVKDLRASIVEIKKKLVEHAVTTVDKIINKPKPPSAN